MWHINLTDGNIQSEKRVTILLSDIPCLYEDFSTRLNSVINPRRTDNNAKDGDPETVSLTCSFYPGSYEVLTFVK